MCIKYCSQGKLRPSGFARVGSGIVWFSMLFPNACHAVTISFLKWVKCAALWNTRVPVPMAARATPKQTIKDPALFTDQAEDHRPSSESSGSSKAAPFPRAGIVPPSSEGVFTQRTLSRLPMKGLLGATPARMTLCGRLTYKTLLWAFKVEPDVSCCLHGV